MNERAHGQLGDFLRSRRARLTPKAVGLPAGIRRRASGLRREEVADLAGIGVDWYTRLEQGRSVSPSMATVDALARALRLTKAEHAHLKALALSGRRRPFRREQVPATLRLVLDGLSQPAYITGQRWDVLAWNSAAADVFAFDRVHEDDRNVLISILANPATRKMFGAAWPDEARRVVAQFRPTYDLWSGDPAFDGLLQRLQHACTEFQSWWTSHEVLGVKAGRKVMRHPKLGRLVFDYASFQSNDDPALKLIVYTPV